MNTNVLTEIRRLDRVASKALKAARRALRSADPYGDARARELRAVAREAEAAAALLVEQNPDVFWSEKAS